VNLSADAKDESLADLGLDSLDVVSLLLAIEEKYGLKIPDEDVAQLQTLSNYAAYIESRKS